MKKLSILILFLTVSLNAFAQFSNEKEIYGNWQVVGIPEKPTNPQFQPLIEGFANSTFSFNENGDFRLTTTSSSELFEMVTSMTNGTQWKLEKNNKNIKIGTAEDNFSTMHISISEFNRNKLFHLSESGLTLEVKKVE